MTIIINDYILIIIIFVIQDIDVHELTLQIKLQSPCLGHFRRCGSVGS